MNLFKRCCICKQKYEGYGNDAYPVKYGRCCDKCNEEVVIPARLLSVHINKTTND